jgi:hypothetical protein
MECTCILLIRLCILLIGVCTCIRLIGVCILLIGLCILLIGACILLIGVCTCILLIRLCILLIGLCILLIGVCITCILLSGLPTCHPLPRGLCVHTSCHPPTVALGPLRLTARACARRGPMSRAHSTGRSGSSASSGSR